MPPRQRQQPLGSGGGADVYFEPIGSLDVVQNFTDQAIKQDLASEDGFAQENNYDSRMRNMIGAYRDPQGGLPAEKGYPIQIGSELFRLSGASIMSDAPSYFSRFFQEQVRNPANVDGVIKTLFIDRDPETFKDIARHLQGYYVHPRDGQHYVKLFADAQFYSLARLGKQLFSLELDVQIGEQQFKIPPSVFSSAGDNPNFFTLAFGMFINPREEPFPGLDREGLIRPPPIEAPKLTGRSGRVFADLLHLLKGYPLKIRDAEHRAELLKDCRYYNLKGLEQKVVFHDIKFVPERQSHEILMRIEDLRQTGISVQWEDDPMGLSTPNMSVRYSRPFTEDGMYELIVEIADNSTMLDVTTMRATFFNQTKTRVASLFKVVRERMSEAATNIGSIVVDGDSVAVELDADADILLDGGELPQEAFPNLEQQDGAENSQFAGGHTLPPKKRKLSNTVEPGSTQWTITKGQWRVCVSGRSEHTEHPSSMRMVLHALKLEALSGQRARNQTRQFLAV